MKPNIIIFNPDQMRADALSHLGNQAAITPFIDKFAEEAVSFRNNFCQNTVCVPSRCSFLTGLYPHVKGHRTMSYMLPKEETSLLKELKESGYYVWMNSRNDFLPAQVEGIFDLHANETFYGGDVPETADLGVENPGTAEEKKNLYSFYFGQKGHDKNGENKTIDDESVDKAIDIIKNRDSDQPFCMFLGLQLPHPPYEIEEPYFSAIDKNKLPKRIKEPDQYAGIPSILKTIAKEQKLAGLSKEEWDNIRSCYLGMCLKVDVLFEKLCNSLKEKGIYDDTAIFFFSDHGDYTGDYGIVEKTQNTFEDCLVNVPLLIKPAKNYKVDPGVSDSLTELIDVYATVLDMCGVSPKHTHFGRSLIPVLEDRKIPNRSFVFSEGGRLAGELHCNETNGKEPSPYNPYYPRMIAQMDDIAHTKATMIRSAEYKYIRRLYEEDEFYDLRNDPQECINEINNLEYKTIIMDMRMQLLEWYQSTCDIVPFEEDQRFNYDMIWNRIKLLCPKELEEEAKHKILGGMDLFQVQIWLRNLVKNNTRD